jgi:hypothetical protein
MISQSLSLPMTTPTAPIGCICFRRGMLVLPFPGKQTFARACRASSPILPSPRDAPGDRLAGPRVLDASIRLVGV